MPDFEKVEKHLMQLLETQMPKLAYHNIHHVRDVLESAQRIARHEGASEYDINLLRIAALLHDIGFIKTSRDHEQQGAAMTRELLPPFGFDQEQIETICRMILATKLPQSPASQLEKILCDADLDYLGRDDFYETGSKLLQEMVAAGVVETEHEWNLIQRNFLQSHKFHTSFGQKNREEKKSDRLQEIIDRLKKT